METDNQTYMQSKMFLLMLFKGVEHNIEIRTFSPYPKKSFFSIIDDAAAYVQKERSKTDIYVGVYTREGRGGDKNSVREMKCLFADLDVEKDMKGNWELARNIIDKFEFKPTMIINSGHGLHLYWILKENVSTEVAGSVERVEATLKGIASYFKADPKVAEIARVMRIPGSLNMKNPSKPVVCYIEAINQVFYTLEDFEKLKSSSPKGELVKAADRNIQQAIEKIIKSCGFMRECWENKSSLPEPLWYEMLSNLARVESVDGEELCHSFSEKHSGYRIQETDKKIRHGLEAGPHTCHYIKNDMKALLGHDCGRDCLVTSPVVLLNRVLSGFSNEAIEQIELSYIPILPPGIRIEDNKIFVINKEGYPHEVCPAFVLKAKLRSSSDTSILCQALTGKEQIIPMTTQDKKAFEKVFVTFLGTGFDDMQLKALKYYFIHSEKLNASQMPTLTALETTGWRSGAFYIPTREYPDTFWTDSNLTSAYSVKGDSGEQYIKLSELLVTRASFVILLGLAAPLLKPLKFNSQNPIFHVSGKQGMGKSCSVNFTMSLYGNPRELQQSWYGTKVGREMLGILNNDLPVWVDEWETGGKSNDSIIDWLYTFYGGKGKTRGALNNKLQKTNRNWNVLFSTGEKNIRTLIQSVQKHRTAPIGLYRRTLEVEVDNRFLLPLGTIDGMTQEELNRELVALYSFADEHYGFVGRDWIEYCEQNMMILQADFHERINGIKDTGGLDRVYGLLLTILNCSFLRPVLSEENREKVEHYIGEMGNLQAKRNMEVKDFVSVVYQAIANFCFQNRQKIKGMGVDTDKNALEGEVINVGNVVNGKSRFSQDVFLLTSGFERICAENGIPIDQVLEELAQKGKLKSAKGKKSYQHRLDGTRLYGYYFREVFVDEPEPEDNAL